MIEIDNYSQRDRKASDIIGPVESDPEYQLIVEANNLAVEIDNEIGEALSTKIIPPYATKYLFTFLFQQLYIAL